MCTGFEIAMAVLSAGGAVMQASAASAQAKSQKNAYEYQAKVSENNAKIAEWQAQNEIAKGQQAEIEQRRKTAALKGSQTASLAARGLDISSGSALNILTDTDYMGEQDALTIRDNAAKAAWSARLQGANETSNAGFYKSAAAGISPSGAAAGSLLGSAGSVASNWYMSSAGKSKGFSGTRDFESRMGLPSSFN
jgi:hypothetical protein